MRKTCNMDSNDENNNNKNLYKQQSQKNSNNVGKNQCNLIKPNNKRKTKTTATK